MLLGNKKKQTEEQNWCVVLNPLRSEMDKRNVARKVSEVFSLSAEEASDLVTNTPIILLDNLTRPVAVKVKDYFRSSNADILLTNDIFLKRKCYRTVWPEPPTLSFLASLEERPSLSPDQESGQVLKAEEAIQEIRSIAQTGLSSAAYGGQESTEKGLSSRERDQLFEELDRWRRECVTRREETERLREEMDRLQKEKAATEQMEGMLDAQVKQKVKEIEEMRVRLDSANEKYEAQKEEYRQARELYEERLSGMVQVPSADPPAGDEKVRLLEERTRTLEAENREMAKTIKSRERQLELIREEKTKEFGQSEEKLLGLLQDLDQEKAEMRFMADKIGILEQEKKILESRLGELTGHQKEVLEAKITQATREIEDWKCRYQEIRDKAQGLEAEREELKRSAKIQEKQSSEWRERYETLQKDHDTLIAHFNDEKFLRLKSEDREKVLEETQRRLTFEAEKKDYSIRQLEAKAVELEKMVTQMRQFETKQEELLQEKIGQLEIKEHELENTKKQLRDASHRLQEREASHAELEMAVADLKKSIEELNESHARQDDLLREKIRQLEIRERELENSRRQLREINLHLEQRELTHKRIQMTNQLADKEGILKHLVKEQEKMESEIRQREESMREILNQQELLEKEIIEIKQSQRHLLEQTKKERSPRRYAPGEGKAEGLETFDNLHGSLDDRIGPE